MGKLTDKLMKQSKIKICKIFSNGSTVFLGTSLNNNNLKQYQVYEKDHLSFFLNNKSKTTFIVKSNYSLKYKNQYLV